MADAMFMYSVTAGIFAFLVAVVFAARGARKRRAPDQETTETRHTGTGGGRGGKKIKKFKSDGTPVYD